MEKRRIRWRLIGVILLTAIFCAIVLQNTEVVEIRILVWRLAMSRIILLVFSLGVGVLVGLFASREKARKPRTPQPSQKK